jgi:hypothetical protein
MPFRINEEATKWFKDIRKDFGQAPMFDMYYFCVIAGLSTNTLTQLPDSETAELVDSFPGEYAAKGRLIMALFISRELRREGVNFSERTSVNASIRRLVDPNSPSRLSSDGMKLMNQYAYGGFEVLIRWFGGKPDERPRMLATFLPLFHRYVQGALEGDQLALANGGANHRDEKGPK